MKRGGGGFGARQQLFVGRSGKLSVSSRSLKLRSRSMAEGGLQPVEGEIQRLAVRHRGQQVADGFRVIAAAPERRAG